MEDKISVIIADASKIWNMIRDKKPLVHHITNFVAMPEQAHITLAIGASPVMAPDIEESAEMCRNAGALLLNIGTPSRSQLKSMLCAQAEANKNKIPVLLDPVGYGATGFRNEAVLKILKNGPVSVIKGNYGEISAMAGEKKAVKGVDSNVGQNSNLPEALKHIAKYYSTIVIATGKDDIITDGTRIISVSGGNPLLLHLTGSGCWLGSIIASAMAVSEKITAAALSGLISLKLASERVKEKNIGSFRVKLFDELFSLRGEDLETKGGSVKWI